MAGTVKDDFGSAVNDDETAIAKFKSSVDERILKEVKDWMDRHPNQKPERNAHILYHYAQPVIYDYIMEPDDYAFIVPDNCFKNPGQCKFKYHERHDGWGVAHYESYMPLTLPEDTPALRDMYALKQQIIKQMDLFVSRVGDIRLIGQQQVLMHELPRDDYEDSTDDDSLDGPKSVQPQDDDSWVKQFAEAVKKLDDEIGDEKYPLPPLDGRMFD